jgi:hypothetical protein
VKKLQFSYNGAVIESTNLLEKRLHLISALGDKHNFAVRFWK